MYVQVITYSLDGIREEQYLDVAHQLASRIAGQPGLLAKLWLENEGENRYGGIYFWEDLESMERFGRSDLFEGRVPEFAETVVEEFSVLENLTAQTQPVLEILQTPRPVAAARPASKKKARPPVKAAGAAGARKVPVKTVPPKKAAAKKAAPKKVASTKAAATKATVNKAPTKKSPVKAPAKGPAKKAT